MVQNRNKLIDLLIGNLSNAVLHRILEKAIIQEKPEIAGKYNKEIKNSCEIAKAYREKINPQTSALPVKGIEFIRKRVISRVNSEISVRILKGYENLRLDEVNIAVDTAMKEIKIA